MSSLLVAAGQVRSLSPAAGDFKNKKIKGKAKNKS
jgi:hypothetical protein